MTDNGEYDIHKKKRKVQTRKSWCDKHFDAWRESNDWQPYSMHEALDALGLNGGAENQIRDALSGVPVDQETMELIMAALTALGLKTGGEQRIYGCRERTRGMWRAHLEIELKSDYRTGMALLGQPYKIRAADVEMLLHNFKTNFRKQPDWYDYKTGLFQVPELWWLEENIRYMMDRTSETLITKMKEAIACRADLRLKTPTPELLQHVATLAKMLKERNIGEVVVEES